MDNKSIILRNLNGHITEIPSSKQAKIKFFHKDNYELAYLKLEYFIYDGQLCNNESKAKDDNFNTFLKIGDHIIFSAYDCDSPGAGKFANTAYKGCKFLAISAWCVEHTQDLQVKYEFGIVNVPVKVTGFSQNDHTGVVSTTDSANPIENIFFHTNKVTIFGQKLNKQLPIGTQIGIDQTFFCDAIPCDSELNAFSCKWIAPAIWRGTRTKNITDKDINTVANNRDDLLKVYKACKNNAKSVYVLGRGHIMDILSGEFGIATITLRYNDFATVLFHRDTCYIQGSPLSCRDLLLDKVLAEGDPVRIICVSAGDSHPFKFVATQVIVVDDLNMEAQNWPAVPQKIDVDKFKL